MIKINSSYKYLLFFFALIALISFCKISNSQEIRVDQCAATIPTVGDLDTLCETQPTIQNIIFHKVAFCTAIPTAPTLTAATVMTNCSTVFENTAGATVSIQKGVGAIPAGTFTDPPLGNYTFAYIELSPRLTYQANLVFSGTRALGSDVQNIGNNADAADNCWTNGQSNWYWDTLRGIDCGAAAAADPAPTINYLNSLDNNEGQYEGRFPGTNGDTDVFLTKSNGTLATAPIDPANPANGDFGRSRNGNVEKLIIFLPMTAKITPDTTNYNLKYNNSRGMIVWNNVNANSTIAKRRFNIGFNVAYFDMTFEIQ
jgi:hypothetical protein